jgi:hypothetical protein
VLCPSDPERARSANRSRACADTQPSRCLGIVLAGWNDNDDMRSIMLRTTSLFVGYLLTIAMLAVAYSFIPV